jgi:Regulator of ribonuclease activity B
MSLFEENASVLRDLEAKGCDLGPSRLIDFSFVFPNQALADAFALNAQREGVSTVVEQVDREDNLWDVTASKDMTPTCETITATEERLDALARLHQGRADGWGFFGIESEANR